MTAATETFLTTFNVVTVVSILLLIKLISVWRQMQLLPPGPFSIPFIGSLCVLTRKQPLQECLHNQTKKYGEITTIWMGMKPTVILSSINAVRAAFNDRSDFDSRPNSVIYDLFDRGTLNSVLVIKYNQRYKELKKQTVSALRFLLEANPLDNVIAQTSHECVERLKAKADGKTNVDMSIYVRTVVHNTMLKVFFGESCKLDDPEVAHFEQLSLNMLSHWDGSQYADKLPWIRRLPNSVIKQLPELKQLNAAFNGIFNLLKEKVDRCVEQRQKNDSAGRNRDLLDICLEQKESLEIREKQDRSDLEPTVQRMTDLFIASVDTSSHTLTWYLMFMALNPESQQRCFEEIKKVIGNRPPTLEDRPNMPFTEATIMETLRLKPFNSFGLPHSCDTDQQLMGYTIPREADLIVNTLAIHHDPEVFKNPNCFDPTNFLDSDGEVRRTPNFVAFGIGRRVCVGENLAKKDLFLIAATLLQNFQFLPIPGRKYNEKAGDYGELFPVADPFELLLKQRNA